ncbi:MAG: PaaI family thioesterase [Pseudomonadota bacterium]
MRDQLYETLMSDDRKDAPGEDTEIILDVSPYARFLGLRVHRSDASIRLRMPYHVDLIGSPFPPRLHGGTVGALMEIAGLVCVNAERFRADGLGETDPKMIGITIDYLRAGAPEDVWASAEIRRMGRRFANVSARAWQNDPEKLIATARMNLLLPKNA